ncbi:hypothetical protein BH10ACI2_BH10ACI2_04280 [soil metagenome]
MSSIIQTLKIAGSEGEPAVMIINADDFDASVHTLYEPAPGEADPSGNAADGEEDEVTVASLVKDNTKDQLVAMATEKGIDIVPDELNKTQIAEKILASE